MLRKLQIQNYRCFNNTSLNFKDITILVGENNAGKSTLVEVLRIISVVSSRCVSLPYKKSPGWIDMNPKYVGVSPSLNYLNISTKNLFHMYGEPPAIITASFSNKAKFEIYVGEDAETFALIFNQKGKLVTSKSQARTVNLRQVNILPQISPLQESETTLKYKTVQSGEDTYLSSRHFRNQIRYNYQYFKKFRELSEKSWSGLAIRDLDGRSSFSGGHLGLIVRDKDFSAEIGWMGHGLQMWLQTMWFLSKCNEDSTVILDEPDVYMHADLQRKLIRLLKGRFKQIMIATHSVEIMSEVEPENILAVDSSKKFLSYANKSPLVQEVIDRIGSVHNIEVARIFSHKKFLIVEGDSDDTKILGILHDTIYESNEPLNTVPKTFVEGWGGWQRVIGSNKVFSDTNLSIKTYCILDSDFHLQEDIKERYEEAKGHGINLHIWRKKEIENYLLVSKAIERLILATNPTAKVNIEMIEGAMAKFTEEMKQEIIDNYATEISHKNKDWAIKTVNEKARKIVNNAWENHKLDIVPGKRLIKILSKWSQDNFQTSFNAFKIARSLEKREIDLEIIEVLHKIENNADLKIV